MITLKLRFSNTISIYYVSWLITLLTCKVFDYEIICVICYIRIGVSFFNTNIIVFSVSVNLHSHQNIWFTNSGQRNLYIFPHNIHIVYCTHIHQIMSLISMVCISERFRYVLYRFFLCCASSVWSSKVMLNKNKMDHYLRTSEPGGLEIGPQS